QSIEKIFNSQLTLEQYLLLGYLSQVQQKNNNRSISLLKDIAHPRVLALRELQAILASFPPKIQETIIKKFNIIDATEHEALEQKAIREKNNACMQSLKQGSIASAIALSAILATWFIK
ncbi:MAG: hypothetical protein P4L31_01475, partial [Candidatus Babeliales bacterium]|nr:hypothetical protein [Candidatus Babeliales bacterium]